MKMLVQERSYSGSVFRPRPEIHLDERTNLLIVPTAWGARNSATKVTARMRDYLRLARGDKEVTSPFQRLSCLSTEANNLRIATMLANESLYREDNKTEFRSGVELFAASLVEDELVWIQIGMPQILLGRHGQNLVPLGSQVDLSFDFSEATQTLAPMPNNLLGLDSTIHPNLNSLRARAGDRIILVSHSHLPAALFAVEWQEVTLDSLSLLMSKAYPDLAFWLAIIDIKESS